MNWGSVPDWVAAFGSIVTAAVAIYLGLITFTQQRKSSDVQLALSIFSSINCYWDRIVDSKGKNYKYDMGQILAHFETASMMFNEEVLSTPALPILKDHIIEVFGSLESSDEGKHLIEACQSSPDTFKELRKFAMKFGDTIPIPPPTDLEFRGHYTK